MNFEDIGQGLSWSVNQGLVTIRIIIESGGELFYSLSTEDSQIFIQLSEVDREASNNMLRIFSSHLITLAMMDLIAFSRLASGNASGKQMLSIIDRGIKDLAASTKEM